MDSLRGYGVLKYEEYCRQVKEKTNKQTNKQFFTESREKYSSVEEAEASGSWTIPFNIRTPTPPPPPIEGQGSPRGREGLS